MDIFNLLLDIGVDVRVPDGDTRRGWNLLAFCIAGKGYSSHLAPHISIHPVLENIATAHEMVENLVEHPRVGMEVAHAMVAECMGNSKITPFMLAASLENVAVVELLKGILLEGGYTHQSSEGHTVLHIAAKTGKPDIVNSLVSTKQPSPNPEEDSKLVGLFLKGYFGGFDKIQTLILLCSPLPECSTCRDSGCSCTRRSSWFGSCGHYHGSCLCQQTKKTEV